MPRDNTDADRVALKAAQDDLPLTERPFAALASSHGVPEDDLLEALRRWLRSGLMRRYGALVSHRKLGYQSNAMVVWQVPPERLEEVGHLFATNPEVTHCYERSPAPELPYNLYTMIHAPSEDECRRLVENLSRVSGIYAYEMLVSTWEFKKDSPRYSSMQGPPTAPEAGSDE
jgi:DNA-binding Lrp family transcriptional regulator